MIVKNLKNRILKQRTFRQLLAVSVLFTLMMGLVIVPIERNASHGTIKNTSDGMWWAIQTLTTVGYGDVTPVTDQGRTLGVILQILGALMFGSLLAIISTSMSRSQEEFYWNRLFDRLNHMEEKLSTIHKDSRYLVKDTTSKIESPPMTEVS